MSELSLRQVKKNYGSVPIIHGVDLEINSGEFVVFVGPSGCGKSTLMRMIAGLEEISDGEVSIGGKIVNDLPPRDRDIAMVFQDYALYPNKSVFENMAFGLRIRKSPLEDIRRRVAQAAETLQITHLLDRLPKALSGGQRQRVAMGRAMVRKPKVFLFDEPLSNLDALLRNQVRAEIKKLHQREGGTVVYVTHDQVEAMTLADRIVVLQAGRIIQVGTPDEIYHQPKHRFVAEFTGSPPMNLFEVKVVRKEGDCAVVLPDGTELPLAAAQDALCLKTSSDTVVFGIRPENLVSTSETSHPQWKTLSLEVTLVEPLGAENVVHLALGDYDLIGRFQNDLRPVQGSRLNVALNPKTLHFFDPATGQALIHGQPANSTAQ
ncbi:ABC transporter ATP-binding protein [Polaromonas sp.]|uniref:ABC transporter ATP-binding protein n=1 Tax=Polaromonas sp. TaxID=1869339 RepID=UPI002FCC4532